METNIIEKYTDWVGENIAWKIFDIFDSYPALGFLVFLISSPLFLLLIIIFFILLPIQFILDIINLLSKLK